MGFELNLLGEFAGGKLPWVGKKRERKKKVDKAGSLGRSGQNPVPDRN